MFSRATKLIVRSFGPRQFHIGEQNLKNVFIGGTGEISRTLSQLLKNSMKLNVLALYDVAAINKPLPNHSRIRDYCDNQPLRETKELVEVLYHLPIAEGAPTLNNSSMPNEIIPKAGNACSGLHPHARLLDKIGPNDTRTRQRDCVIAVIRKCFPGLTCSSFQEYNLIATTKTSRRYPSIKDKDKTGNSSHNVFDVKENNCQSLSSMGLTRRLNNAGELLNTKASCGIKMSTNRLMPEVLLNNKPKWLREIYGRSVGFVGCFPIRTFVSLSNNSIPINRDDDCFRKLLRMNNVILHDILSNLHTQIRSRSTISDFYDRGNISAVNEALAVSVYDLLSDKRTVLFASKDCDSKFNIRRKLEKICALWNRLLRRKDRDDICEKRKKSCKTTEETCQKREEMCQRRTTDCSERRERTCEKQVTIFCSGRKSSSADKDDHDFCKTRKDKCQKQSCAHQKEDLCKKLQGAEPCKRQESKEAKTKEDKCGRSADKDISCKHKEVQKICQKKKVTCEKKKEEDCSDMKKAEPRKEKECPPVKRAPGCTEDREKEEDC